MDIGGFIDSLEYASGVRSMVIGKLSIHFFRIALDDMGLNANEVIVVGDDIYADIGGGQNVGLKAILIKTGKYLLNYVAVSTIQPDSRSLGSGEVLTVGMVGRSQSRSRRTDRCSRLPTRFARDWSRGRNHQPKNLP